MALIREVIEGLQILEKYCDKGSSRISAEHDVIYAGPGYEDVPAEDAAKLEALGWHQDEEADCWARFV